MSPTPTTPATTEPAHQPPRQPDEPAPERFDALAAAVRAHGCVTGHSAVPMRPSDHALYRRLAEI